MIVVMKAVVMTDLSTIEWRRTDKCQRDELMRLHAVKPPSL